MIATLEKTVLRFLSKAKNKRWNTKKNISIVLYFFVCTYVMVSLQLIGDSRHMQMYQEASPSPLYNMSSIDDTDDDFVSSIALLDLGHGFLPYYRNERLLDAMVNSAVILGILSTFLEDPVPSTMRKVLFIIGSTHLIRGLSLFVTTLPNPYDSFCMNTTLSSFFLDATKVFFRYDTTCSDIILSGHMSMTTTGYIFCYYGAGPKRITRPLGAIYLAVVGVLLLSSRYHYSVDVLLGFLVTLGIHVIYNVSIRLHEEVNNKDASQLSIPHLAKNEAVPFSSLITMIGWVHSDEEK